MTVDTQLLAARPGDVIYIRETAAQFHERIAAAKARAMDEQLVVVVRGLEDVAAESLATLVVDVSGRLVKDRRGDAARDV